MTWVLVPLAGVIALCVMFYSIGAGSTSAAWIAGGVVAVVVVILATVVNFLRNFRM